MKKDVKALFESNGKLLHNCKHSIFSFKNNEEKNNIIPFGLDLAESMKLLDNKDNPFGGRTTGPTTTWTPNSDYGSDTQIRD